MFQILNYALNPFDTPAVETFFQNTQKRVDKQQTIFIKLNSLTHLIGFEKTY